MMEDKQNIDTVFIRDEISRCEDVEDLKNEIFPLLKSQQEQWAEKINQVIKDAGLNKSKFAQACGISRPGLAKWCKGAIPRNRSTYIRIGMVAGYNVEQINQLLTRYGRYTGLYSKTLEDCVCIFVASHNYGDKSLETYEYILSKIKEQLENASNDFEDVNTVFMDEQLAKVKDEQEMEVFIADNIDVFATAYRSFYAYVKMIIESYFGMGFDNVYEMALAQDWSSSLRQCVSAIYQKKWIPTRNKIISLGLHLNMDHDQVDSLLELAHMEPLCAKNIFESVIMFILDDAELNDMLDVDGAGYDPDWQLYQYAREILEEVDMPEMNDFIAELSSDEEDW